MNYSQRQKIIKLQFKIHTVAINQEKNTKGNSNNMLLLPIHKSGSRMNGKKKKTDTLQPNGSL